MEKISAEGMDLLEQIAAASVAFGIDHDSPITYTPQYAPEELGQDGGAFVTLHYKQDEIGCSGEIYSGNTIFDTVRMSAFRSSQRDLRYARVRNCHLKELSLTVYVLAPQEIVVPQGAEDSILDLAGDSHSVVMRVTNTRISSIYLPHVVRNATSARTFIEKLKKKAKINPELGNDKLQFFIKPTQYKGRRKYLEIPQIQLPIRD